MQLLDLLAIDADDGTAKGPYRLIKSSLLNINIKISQVIGKCSNNASVMIGIRVGIKETLCLPYLPFVLYTYMFKEYHHVCTII